jgi:hypothetical protein
MNNGTRVRIRGQKSAREQPEVQAVRRLNPTPARREMDQAADQATAKKPPFLE